MAHIHGVFDSDAHFSVDPITKTLKNESSQKTTVIQKDHNSERFTFEIPRMIEGHDMSLCNDVKVHYINIDASTKQENKGVYAVDDMQISQEDDQVVICSWLVSGNATQLKGTLAFSISYSCVTDDLDYCLNTAAYKGISVAEGVYCGDYVAEEYADILVQWEEELKNAVTDEQIQEAVNAYLEENPLEETDPTVPGWAKAESKPGYSLSELTEDAEHRTVTDAEKTTWNAKSNFSGSYNDLKNIPPAYSLPIATPTVLGGVKPVAVTADMTQAVGVDADGLLFTAPGSGGETAESRYNIDVLVQHTVTAEEAAEVAYMSFDLPRNYREYILIYYTTPGSTSTGFGIWGFNSQGSPWTDKTEQISGNIPVKTSGYYIYEVQFAVAENGNMIPISTMANANNSGLSCYMGSNVGGINILSTRKANAAPEIWKVSKNRKSIALGSYQAGWFGEGAIIAVYGIGGYDFIEEET